MEKISGELKKDYSKPVKSTIGKGDLFEVKKLTKISSINLNDFEK